MKTKAVRLYGKEDLRLEEFELPEMKDDEILAKVVSDSICMSSYNLLTTALTIREFRMTSPSIPPSLATSSPERLSRSAPSGKISSSLGTSSQSNQPSITREVRSEYFQLLDIPTGSSAVTPLTSSYPPR